MSFRQSILIGLACGFGVLRCDAAPSTADVMWHEQVRPLLDKHCFRCHGGVYQKGDLDLRSLPNMLKGGERGPALVPGQPEQSRLAQFVLENADPHMPPNEKTQLAPDEVALLKNWIAALPQTGSPPDNEPERTAQWAAEYLKELQESRRPAWVPPAHMSSTRVINRFIRMGWKERQAQPSPVCDDRTFVRRVYLDLAGRIPTRTETEAFLQDQRRNRRARLVDQLLASEDYARRMREVFDVVLMQRRGERSEKERQDNAWFEYLETAFRENRLWNQLVRELIVARPSESSERGALWFLYERRNNYQAMAEAVAPVAFGMQIGCAQCHNDPLAWEVEQRHYWGLVAAFNRSTNVTTARGIGLAESAIGGFVNFANLKKESQPALLAFLNGKVIEEKRPEENEKQTDTPDLYLVPPPLEQEKPEAPSVPKFSRREALAEAVTRDNPMLARAFVNRAWAMLLGHGLVDPVDQMDSRHPPSHPDLLDWLAQDFEQSGYDIKRLIRTIVLSRPYQLESRPATTPAPPPEAFARALEKPLSAEQFWRSILIATGHGTGADGNAEYAEADALRRQFIERFPDLLASEARASLPQAMFLSNSPLIDELLSPQPDNTTARLAALDSNRARIDEAFVTAYGRRPDREELDQSEAFLRGRGPEAGVQQLLWALLASAEFQLNH